MTFPTEQQVETASQEIFYVLGRYRIYPSMAKEAARAALTALAPEWREMERDAERYRWLRNQIQSGPLVIAKVSMWGLCSWSGDIPDQIIDAAREREGGEG